MAKMDEKFIKDITYQPPIGLASQSVRNMSPTEAKRFGYMVSSFMNLRDQQDANHDRGTKIFDKTAREMGSTPEIIRRQLDSIDGDQIAIVLQERRSDADLDLPELTRRDVLSASYDALYGDSNE